MHSRHTERILETDHGLSIIVLQTYQANYLIIENVERYRRIRTENCTLRTIAEIRLKSVK